MNLKKAPILYIEDSKSDQKLFEMALFELDVPNEVVIAEDGASALKYLRTTLLQTFLIISDINMPGMNGIEMKEEIEKDTELKKKSIPFIFMSSSGTAEEIEQAYLLGVQGYFVKPTSLEELIETLGMVINYWKTCKHPKNAG